ncbi:MAG: protein kinase [Hungatella sp.]|nr:protein kinase [Hungatella sp.]
MPTTQTLCYNCFQQVADPSAPCPHCGFDLAENQQKFPVALRAGTVLNNRYIVGRVLGQGGFGITYVAFDTQLQARVAIKEYMPSDMATRVEGTTVSVMMDTRAEDFTYGAERFQEEARTLAKFIGHPNIAGVSSYFDENDTSYFVMDYIEGVSFKSYIANNGGKVSVDEALNVMIPVLRALTAVHAEGFIHRDVTPDNIYISKDGNVKLLDFGSARYSIGDKSKSLDVILKVGYAPKEQYIRRGRQGPYTDVYSCAACFYAALTGYLPPESLERLDQDTLVPVSQVLPEIPEWLDKAILKGLAVQPEDRFQSAAEFLDAIENQLVVDVPAAGGPAQPAKKKLNPLMLGGIAAAIVVVLGLGVVLGGRGGGNGDGGGILEALAPKVTIAGQEYSASAEELDLRGLEKITLTDEDLNTIQGMSNVKRLRMYCNTMPSLEWLAAMPQLEIVSISGQNAVYENLDFLSGLTNLKVLRLPMLPQGAEPYDISALANLTDLTSIHLPVGIQDLTPLQNLTKLESLNLSDGYGVDGLGHTVYSLEPLRNLTNLTELKLRIWSLDTVDISHLSGMTKMKELELEVQIVGSNKNQTNCGISDLSALSGMKELEMLTLQVSNLSDISPLRGLEKLTFFSLVDNGWGNNITDWSPVDHVKTVVGRD